MKIVLNTYLQVLEEYHYDYVHDFWPHHDYDYAHLFSSNLDLDRDSDSQHLNCNLTWKP